MPQELQSMLESEWASRLIFFFMLAFGLSMFVSLMRRGLKMAGGKAITVTARMVAREHGPARPGEAGERYVLVFEAGGPVLRFSVSRRQYEEAEGWQKGKLTYQGGGFIRFHPQSPPGIYQKK